MKFKILGYITLVLLVLINIWAVIFNEFWLENTTYILFFMSAVFLVLHVSRRFTFPMFFFLGIITLSYLVRYFQGEHHSFEISLVLLTAAHVILIKEAARHIIFKSTSRYILIYFILIVGINGSMLGYHLMELREYTSSNLVFIVYSLYYLNLLILGITSLVYYLNSYSKRSMFFISLSLAIIFADVLRDMSIFYQKGMGVSIAESIVRLACAVFAVLFFVTKEKQLRLIKMLN